MITLIRRSTVLGALAALSLLGTSARADLIIQVGENGGALTTVVDTPGNPTAPGGVSGVQLSTPTADYTISILSGTEMQTSADSQLLSSTLSITQTSGVAGQTLNIVIQGTLFSGPTAPPAPGILVSSSLGGSFGPIHTTGDNIAFTTQVGGATVGGTGTFDFPTTTGTGNYTAEPDVNTAITSLTAPFTIEQDINVTLNGATDVVQFTANTNLQAVPEPSTMAIAGLGALGMIGYGLRRRKAKGA